MNQKKPQHKRRLVHTIGLYILCLLAAFCTWIAVMYAEEQAEKSGEAAEPAAQTLCLPADEVNAWQSVTVAL